MTHSPLTDLILQNTNDAIVIINPDLNIVLANPVALDNLGLTANQVIGKTFDSIFKFIDDNNTSFSSIVQKTITQGVPTPFYNQTTLLNHENKSIPISYRMMPLEQEGSVRLCVFIFEYQQFSRYRTDFLSLVAHQLKTPLGSMRWNLESALENYYIAADPAFGEIIEDVYNCNSRMISLVDDLLNASRIDLRKVANKPVPTNISQVLSEAVKELSHQIQQKHLQISQKLQYTDDIVIDSQHFREVVQNLLSNAIKYNRPNGIITVISTKTPDYVSITIEDTGIGIPNSDLPRVFSHSFRARNAIESQVDGSGLGLYVAKSFVEDWGGQISCNSIIGQGTAFTFTIPFQLKSSSLNVNLT